MKIKATVENISNPNLKFEDFELEFGWMHIILHYKNEPDRHQLMFSELTFLPDFNDHMFDPNATAKDRARIGAGIYTNGRHWPSFVQELMKALKVQQQLFPKLQGTTISCNAFGTENTLIHKLKDLNMDSLIPEIEKMPHYEWTM